MTYLHDFVKKYTLSMDGYYFQYCLDPSDPKVIRANLYRQSDDQRIDHVRVSAGRGIGERSHLGVISYFESRIHLKHIF